MYYEKYTYFSNGAHLPLCFEKYHQNEKNYTETLFLFFFGKQMWLIATHWEMYILSEL